MGMNGTTEDKSFDAREKRIIVLLGFQDTKVSLAGRYPYEHVIARIIEYFTYGEKASPLWFGSLEDRRN